MVACALEGNASFNIHRYVVWFFDHIKTQQPTTGESALVHWCFTHEMLKDKPWLRSDLHSIKARLEEDVLKWLLRASSDRAPLLFLVWMLVDEFKYEIYDRPFDTWGRVIGKRGLGMINVALTTIKHDYWVGFNNLESEAFRGAYHQAQELEQHLLAERQEARRQADIICWIYRGTYQFEAA